MKSNFLLVSLCSLSVLLPIHAQDEVATEQPTIQSFENLTFEDAASIVSYMRSNLFNWQHEEELWLISSLLHEEQATILKRLMPDLSLVGNYYKTRNYIHPDWFDESIRYHAAQDLFNIALYRFVYKTAMNQAYMLDPNAEELLLLKQMFTPKAYDESYHWIHINRAPLDLSAFSCSIQEKVIAFVKSLSFDELMILIIASNIRMQDKSTDPSFFSSIAESADNLIALNQKIRSIFEQEKQPERRALTRLLYSDQAFKNMYVNGKLFTDAFGLSKKPLRKTT